MTFRPKILSGWIIIAEENKKRYSKNGIGLNFIQEEPFSSFVDYNFRHQWKH